MQTADRYAVAKHVLSRIAPAVAIIGSAKGDERGCGTGTTMYVSLAPAMIAIAEHRGSRTTRLIKETGEFSVSLLHDSQQDVAVSAGKPAEVAVARPRRLFVGVEEQPLPVGAPAAAVGR